MRRFLLAAVCLWSFFAVLGVGVLAQSTTEINGTVRDASNALLPGVTVTLNGPQQDQVATAVTDAEGRYHFGGVTEGTYVITFSREGFASLQRPPFRMLAGYKARIDATLKMS